MSVALAVDAEVRAGVALVAARVENPTPVARRVRVANRLAGPVLPPRRHGVPEAGWDDDGVTAVVDAGGTLALGYACPLDGREPAEPPAELVDVGAPEGRRVDAVAQARRELGAWRPPRDAVATRRSVPAFGTGDDEFESDPSTSGSTDRCPDDGLPVEVEEYLDRVEERVDLARRLTGASVPEATDALADCEVPVATLADAVEDDAEVLRVLCRRATELASRAESTEVPVDALWRLA